MTRLKADLSLLLAALIWGTAFVAQKYANDSMPPILFVGCRFIISALLVAPLALYETRKLAQPLSRRDWSYGAQIGLCLFASVAGQQIGMVTTTATNAGFLTALYVVLVPVVAWLMHRHAPSLTVVGACAVSLAGAWMLAGKSSLTGWNHGDLLVVFSDIFFALQIILVARFLRKGERPFLLSFLQYLVSGVIGIVVGALVEPVEISGILAAGPAILYAGLLSGGVAFTLQIIAQRHTPAAEAAIIMSLESVFAAIAGAVMLGDRLQTNGIIGCVLILAGVVLVQLVPSEKG